ncbi:MAG: alpha/beta fold hydrolase [Pseudomonadota bacterium]
MSDCQGLFKAEDGTSLYYEMKGQGRPLVFCYGLTCRKEHWHHQIEHFSKKYRVITFDYRGHHNSSKPANDQHLTLDWCAKDLVALFDHLELKEAVVLGHSFGVPVLSKFIPLLPGKVTGAIFICGSVTNPFDHMFHSNRMTRVHQLTSFIQDQVPELMGWLWHKFTKKNRLNFLMTSQLGFNASRAKEKDVFNYIEGVHRTPFNIFYSLITDYARYDGRPFLNQIECPTLLLAGDADHITPYSLQEEMASLIPNSRLVKIPGGSHNAHMDFPDKVNLSIESFLSELEF